MSPRNRERSPAAGSESVPPWQQSAASVGDELNADVLFLNGPIHDHISFAITNICESRNRRENVIFLLITEGGSADAAYRIARCLQALYERFYFFVSGFCKSAGTLVGLGAHEIIIADQGELGPLDVQLRREDELFQTRSGLTVLSALSTLHEHAFEAYEYFLLQMNFRSGGDITTKTSAQVAAGMAGELFGRVYEHIDPMHVGEAGRFLKIAHQYGQVLQRKGENCKQNTLDTLTTQYPSHSFIIDRLQAEDLFNNVREPSPSEAELARQLGVEALKPRGQKNEPLLAFLNVELVREQDSHENTKEERVVSTPKSNGGTDDSEAHKSRVGEDSPGQLVEVGRATS